MKMNKMRYNSFTLVELILVIVIIGIIAAVAIPQFASLRQDAQNTADDDTISTIKRIINTLYMKNKTEGKDEYPTGAEIADALPNLNMTTEFEPRKWCYKDYGDTVIFYCDHGVEANANGRRWWTYYRVDKDGHHAGDVVEGSERH